MHNKIYNKINRKSGNFGKKISIREKSESRINRQSGEIGTTNRIGSRGKSESPTNRQSEKIGVGSGIGRPGFEIFLSDRQSVGKAEIATLLNKGLSPAYAFRG